jgi:hypothetical protein
LRLECPTTCTTCYRPSASGCVPSLLSPLSLWHYFWTEGCIHLAAHMTTRLACAQLAAIHLENTEEHRRQLRELLFTTPGFEEKISGVILYCETLFQKASHQKGEEGIPLPQILLNKGVVVGVKVDLGLVDIPFTEGETVRPPTRKESLPTVLGLGFASRRREDLPSERHDRTRSNSSRSERRLNCLRRTTPSQVTQGLDDLGKRCHRYYNEGARFAKWRAVIHIQAVGEGDAKHSQPSELAIRCVPVPRAHNE